MIGARQRQIGIKATGTTVSLPNAPMARLMYYLSTVDGLTDFGIPDNLTNYGSYSYLSFDEENQVLTLAALLSPDLFIDKGIMINEPRLCPDANNEFYEISDVRTAVAITQEFAIAGKQVHTLRIMAFKKIWIETNYVNPISNYVKRIQAIANGNVENYRPRPAPRQIQYQPSPPPRYSENHKNDDVCSRKTVTNNRDEDSYSSYSEYYSYSDYSYSSHHHHHRHHHHHKHQNSCCVIM